MKTALMTVIVAVAACGGSAKPGSSSRPDDSDSRDRAMSHMGGDHQTAHKAKGDHREGEMGMPPQLAKFHDTLAPRWHAEHGPKRMADTCAAIPQFHSGAEAIASVEPPPKGDAVAWSKGGKKLTEAVAALDAKCRSKDAEGFEPAFARVHEVFHGLLEVAGGHGEGDHEKHDEDKHE